MKTIVSVPGIHCSSCAALIKEVSSDFPSIHDITVDLDAKKVTLDHDEGFDLETWSQEVEALDPAYTVHPLP